MFVIASFINGIQAFMYVSVPRITMAYYQTNMKGVTWTATIISVGQGVAIIPATLFMDIVSLRMTLLTATGTMGLGIIF